MSVQPTRIDRQTSQAFLDSAIAVSDAVLTGADPADPAVQEFLNMLVEEFQPTVAIGTDARDVLVANQNTLNYINALGGDDVVQGSRNTDVLVGADGNDVLFGGRGADGLFGGNGDDVLFGEGGNDIIRGDDGNDTIDGGNGKDELSGGAGNDVIDAGNGRDTINGDDGTDIILAGDGADVINGGAGVDTITGGNGADAVVFDGDRFTGGAVIDDDGVRQAVNTPDVLTDWSISDDRFVLDTSDFLVTGELNFFNGLAADIPEGGVNVIVLQDTDNDNNPATAFNAGAAASLIAANVETSGAGFFIYHNSGLQINRLVYSSDLSDPTADIAVLANIDTLKADDAIAALSTFSAENFDFIA